MYAFLNAVNGVIIPGHIFKQIDALLFNMFNIPFLFYACIFIITVQMLVSFWTFFPYHQWSVDINNRISYLMFPCSQSLAINHFFVRHDI